MPDFKAQVFVCATVDAEVDGRHCGSKGGSEIRAKFNRQIVEHGLISTAAVNGVGCTSQHGLCAQEECSVIVIGPKAEMGATWYVITPDDVDEIITEHLIGGRVVERLVNKERAIKFS